MENKDNRTNNRMVLLLIAGIPVTMILGATWLWYFVVRGDLDLVGTLGTANRGALVQPPRQIDEVDVREPNGSEFDYGNLEPKWTMVIPGEAGRCDTDCENTLYLTKQIHTAMGKEYNRLRRAYVSETAPDDTRLTVQELSDKRPAPACLRDLSCAGASRSQAPGPGCGRHERVVCRISQRSRALVPG